ncbi:MAG: PASTA domain-containing protein [Clostridia bacterium]|nr:PASTA domain-containing protein [Clostridia bacterium]
MNDRRAVAGRIMILVGFFALALAIILIRLCYIQFVKGDEYKQKAYTQYTKETVIKAKRGTIYDRNMKEMAISITAEDCIIVPSKIKNPEYIDTEQRAILEKGLCELLEISSEDLNAHIAKDTSYRKIKEKIDIETANKVREFVYENKLGEVVYFEESTKRFYPGNELASTVLGFTGYTENSGAEVVGITGIERQYDSYLQGTPGRILTAKNGVQEEMPFKYESYIEAENGMNIVLTIDWTIQSYLEKHLETALRDNKATNKVCGIIMDINTGEVLAMSSKPDFNPNNHNMLTDLALEFQDSYLSKPENKDKTVNDYKNYLWKNKAVQELYEPGSTFKIVTSAMALEENVVTESERFYCTGVRVVGGWPIKCHKVAGHGYECFEEGLQNSCNPVFMEVAERLGKTSFYNYFKSFGMNEKTGIDLPYESDSIYHNDINGFNQTELAVYSFGQTFKITPIRLITTLAACANGGSLMKPYVVRKLVDDDGNTIESFSPEVVRQVSSDETSKKIMEYLYNGINVGSTKNAYVKGYKVAAKTGTSQKRDMEEGYYVSSCVSFAPADDPQIAILIIVDEPSAGAYYGGTVAAPVASAVLSDVLPYLNVEKSYTEKEKSTLEVTVRNYTGYAVEEAKRIGKADGFNIIVKGNGEVVNEQLPRGNSAISAGGTIILYTGDEVPAANVTVPNLKNYSATQATNVLESAGLNIKITGAYREGVQGAVAVKQDPEGGSLVTPGTTVTVEFKHNDSYD